MADVKISALPLASTPLAGTEVLPIVQSATTDQVSVANLTAGRAVSAASLTLTTTPLAVGSGGTGLSTLTAGYIPYGNGTSAFGSSSNLFWDATNSRLGIGTNGPTGQLQITATTSANNTAIIFNGSSTYYNRLYLTNAGADGIFGVEGSTANQLVSNSSAYSFNVGTIATAPLNFVTANSVRATIDASGNLGLGVSPSAWYSGNSLKVLQVSSGASIYGFGSSDMHAALGNNVYLKSVTADYTYITSTYATLYDQSSGKHIWYNAPSGTANATISFTQAMTLDASGNLGIGTSSPSSFGAGYIVTQVQGSTSGIVIVSNGTNSGNIYANSVEFGVGSRNNVPTIFVQNNSERARIDGSGNVVINTAAIATNATDGFLYVPTCAGTPTGTPTTYTGRAPIVVNTTNNKLYFYSGGAWRDAGP